MKTLNALNNIPKLNPKIREDLEILLVLIYIIQLSRNVGVHRILSKVYSLFHLLVYGRAVVYFAVIRQRLLAKVHLPKIITEDSRTEILMVYLSVAVCVN